MQIVNTEQAEAWDGHEGDVWTDHADRYEHAGWRIWNHFADAQLIGVTDDVVDIGCGTGHSTRAAARIAASGHVLGLDLSKRMLGHARERSEAEGLKNIEFVQADAQVYLFTPSSFDIALSSFGAMFFSDPAAAFSNMATGLRDSGRLALLAWRTLPENEWLMGLRGALAAGRDLPMPPPDAPTPFSLADPDRVRMMLESAGYTGVELTAVDEPMDFGVDVDDAYTWVKTMGIVEGLSHGLDEAQLAQADANIRQLLVENETPDGVQLNTAAWLITATKS